MPVEPDNIDGKHLDMMIPGFRLNPALRPNYVSTEPNHENNVDDNLDMPSLGSDSDTSENVQSVNSCVSSSTMNNSPQLPSPKIMKASKQFEISSAMLFTDKLRACQEYMNGLAEELEIYKKQINEERQKNEALENELKEKDLIIQKYCTEIHEAKSKQWCKECLNPIQVEQAPMCVNCSLFK